MRRRTAAGRGNPHQAAGRHTGSGAAFDLHPLGQARRVTRHNNQIEDRGNNDPHTR